MSGARQHIVLLTVALLGCSDEPTPQGAAEPTAPAPAAAETQHAVLPAGRVDAASFDQMVGELGIQVDEGVPADEAESLQHLMSNSGYRIKRIRLVAPGCYAINVWGDIPHAASEFTVRRNGTEWEIVGDTPWVLIGAAER